MESIQTLLVVDDNPADIRFIEEAFPQSEWNPDIHSVTSTTEATAYLDNQPPYQDAQRHNLILLDWHLAEKTAEDVLKAINTGYSDIPVIVMASSQTQEGIINSLLEAADSVIEKPTDTDGYIEAIRSL